MHISAAQLSRRNEADEDISLHGPARTVRRWLELELYIPGRLSCSQRESAHTYQAA